MSDVIINGIVEESQEILGRFQYSKTISSADQNYIPTSENAQSGKAVAEALKTLDVEFIKEITLTEDVGSIDILTKSESIELRDTLVYCRFAFTESGNKLVSLRKDGGTSYYIYGNDAGTLSAADVTNNKIFAFGFFIHPLGESGAVLTFGLQGLSYNIIKETGYAQGLEPHNCKIAFTNAAPISYHSQKIDNLNMFLVNNSETNLIKSGSKIWLFGRRVK